MCHVWVEIHVSNNTTVFCYWISNDTFIQRGCYITAITITAKIQDTDKRTCSSVRSAISGSATTWTQCPQLYFVLCADFSLFGEKIKLWCFQNITVWAEHKLAAFIGGTLVFISVALRARSTATTHANNRNINKHLNLTTEVNSKCFKHKTVSSGCI